MGQLWLLFACAGIGVLLRRSGRAPRETPAALNAVCLHVALPALTLLELHRAPLGGGGATLAPALMPWAMFALSLVFFLTLARRRGWPPGVTGALVLTAGLGNTSFVGFPLLEALLGPPALATGVIVDQLGSFPALATVGVATAFWFAARGGASATSPAPVRRAVFHRLVRFTPFWATAIALLTRPWAYPVWLSMDLSRLAQTLVPLALISVGYQSRLDLAALGRIGRPLAYGLGFKLLLFPGLCAAAWWAMTGFSRGRPELTAQVVLLEAAMAPMITAGVLAEETGLDAELARAMVTIGIGISLVSVPVWSLLLR